MTLHHVFWLSRTPLGFIFSLKKPRETLQKNLKPSTQIFRVSCPTCPSTYLEEQQTYHTFWWSQHRQVEELSLLTVLKEVTIQHIMEIKYSSVRLRGCSWEDDKRWRHRRGGKGLKLHPEDIIVQNTRSLELLPRENLSGSVLGDE